MTLQHAPSAYTAHPGSWADDWLSPDEARGLRALEAASDTRYRAQYAHTLKSAQDAARAHSKRIRAKRVQLAARAFTYASLGILTAVSIGVIVRAIVLVFGP